MLGDTGCCGSNFKREGTTFLGLLTLSLPIIILCGIIIPVVSIIGSMNPYINKIKKAILIILRANLHLIHAASLNPKTRCKLAGRIFSYSPKFSGMIYRYFNLLLLILSWVGIILCFYLIASFKGS